LVVAVLSLFSIELQINLRIASPTRAKEHDSLNVVAVDFGPAARNRPVAALLEAVSTAPDLG
jgi:hypothetical protein